MDIETKLAQASLDRVSRRDPNKIYHRTDPKALVKVAPGFDWAQYFASVGTPGVQVLNVTHPPFATQVGQVVRKVPRAALRNYLAWHLISSQVIALPKPFSDACRSFEFLHLNPSFTPWSFFLGCS